MKTGEPYALRDQQGKAITVQERQTHRCCAIHSPARSAQITPESAHAGTDVDIVSAADKRWQSVRDQVLTPVTRTAGNVHGIDPSKHKSLLDELKLLKTRSL
jgi:hypothetical protein